MTPLVTDSSVVFKWYRQPGDEEDVLIDPMLAEEALRVARELAITFYDASFVALSNLLHGSFVTAEKKLYAKTRSLPAVIYLGNF